MRNFKLLSAGLIIISTVLLASISCADTPKDSLNKNSQKYLSFYEEVDGEQIHWEANFDENKITSIYKNGKKIPDDLLDDYKDKVYSQLDEMRFGRGLLSFRMRDFKIDMDDLCIDMEKLREKFKDHRWNPEEFRLDEEKLKKDLDELKESLKEHNIEKFNWRFDNEEFKERMNSLEEYLKDFDFEFFLDDENSQEDEA